MEGPQINDDDTPLFEMIVPDTGGEWRYYEPCRENEFRGKCNLSPLLRRIVRITLINPFSVAFAHHYNAANRALAETSWP
jgi:hypothetical protein